MSVARVRKDQSGKTAAARAIFERERESVPLRLRHGQFEVRWTPLSNLAADPASWRDLAGRAIEPNVFLEPAFASAALGRIGPRDPGAVAVYAGKKLIGLLPGRVEGWTAGRPVPLFVAWTHPFAPLSTPLLDRDMAGEAAAAMLEILPKLPGAPKAALFPLLPETSVAARLIALQAEAKGRSVMRFAIHARAVLIPDRDEALNIVSAGNRKELRRQRRRLAEQGVLDHRVGSDTGDVRAALADFIDVEASGWKGRTGGAAARNPQVAAFMAEALAALARERKVRIDRLTLDGATIAATITLFSRDYAWFWKIGYDEAYARYSPGVQIALDLTDALETEKSLSLVDSCAVADHPMIDRLWGGRRAMADWLVPLDGPLSFAAAGLAEHLRRAAIAPLKAIRKRSRR